MHGQYGLAWPLLGKFRVKAWSILGLLGQCLVNAWHGITYWRSWNEFTFILVFHNSIIFILFLYIFKVLAGYVPQRRAAVKATAQLKDADKPMSKKEEELVLFGEPENKKNKKSSEAEAKAKKLPLWKRYVFSSIFSLLICQYLKRTLHVRIQTPW